MLHYQLPPGLEAYYQEAGRYPTEEDAQALYRALQSTWAHDRAARRARAAQANQPLAQEAA